MLDTISNQCKIIFPSTHVIYEGINQVKKDIDENEEPCPVLSYGKSKYFNENQLKKSGKKLYNIEIGVCIWLFHRYN